MGGDSVLHTKTRKKTRQKKKQKRCQKNIKTTQKKEKKKKPQTQKTPLMYDSYVCERGELG